MRTKILVIVIAAVCALCFPNTLFAGNGNEKNKAAGTADPACLGLCVRPVISGEYLPGSTVTLYCGSQVIERIDSAERSKIYFTLQRDRYYTVEVAREGYVSRLVGVSTVMPHAVSLKPIFRFEFDVELLRVIEGADDFYLDFPAGLIAFNRENEVFEHSRKYLGWIRRELGKMKEAGLTVK